MGLGDLERDVMDVIWSEPGTAMTVREMNDHFPDHAYTTILTVLSRLTVKGFLLEQKVGRLSTFRASASREDYITSLILDALNDTDDRRAALAHFAKALPASDKSFFRRFFGRTERS